MTDTTQTPTIITGEFGDPITVGGPFGTMSDIRRRHYGHWFDVDTMRFFKSRFPNGEYGVLYGRFFISTEKYSDDTARLATIRYVTDDGDIRTLGGFQAYKSPAAAAKALSKIIQDARNLQQSANERGYGVEGMTQDEARAIIRDINANAPR